MAFSNFVARFNFSVGNLPFRVWNIADVNSAGDLKKRCLEWEQDCDDQRQPSHTGI
jgi:hypothetical protein